jgi:hypothetical protein
MRKIIHITITTLLFFCTTTLVFGQEKTTTDPDAQIKETLYIKYKKEVRTYDKNDFDKLFFEFFESQNAVKVLTKEEFYTYTIKIAIYSEKLGLLYKDQKAEAEKTKQEWFARSYQDYLNSKK